MASVKRRDLILTSLAFAPALFAVGWGVVDADVRGSALALALKLGIAGLLAVGLGALGRVGVLKPFLARRLIALVVVLIGSSTLVFGALRMAPGDPIDSILGDQAAPEERARLAQALCLDKPLIVQYNDCFWDTVLDGSMGMTFDTTPQPVIELLAEAFPATAELALAGMLVSICIAFPLGLLAALKRGQLTDHLASMFALLGVATPAFWIGPMLLLAFTVSVDWLPSPARTDQPLAALVLPAITLGTALSAKLTRMIRGAVLEAMGDDYVLTATAKGLPGSVIMVKHVLRNAMIPIVTVLGIQFGALLTGAIITEKVFARPGIGTLLLEAIQQRDYPVVQGVVLLIATTYVLVNLATDLLYAAFDPRVRLSR